MAAEWYLEVAVGHAFARMAAWEEQQLEQAFMKGDDTFTYVWKKASHSAEMDPDMNKYILDLRAMTQTNEHTKTVRRMIRLTPTAHQLTSPFGM